MANLDVDAASMQQRELAMAQSTCTDLDYAFELQLQEALAASLGVESLPDHRNDDDNKRIEGAGEDDTALVLKLQSLEFEKYQQELNDHKQATQEMRHVSEEIYRRNYDSKFAQTILDIPEDEWENNGDNYEEPFEPAQIANDDRPFKMYYKGLISCESIDGTNNWESFAAFGLVIFDPNDNMVLKLQKPLGSDLSRAVTEYMALIEGLSAVLSLGIRNVTAFSDSVQIHKQVLGHWKVKQRKISRLLDQVQNQIRSLDKAYVALVPRCENRLALKLAREAIDTQLAKRTKFQQQERLTRENCTICLEDNDVSQMFEVIDCLHRYCVSCMAQHVEVKLRHGYVPACPHEGCTSKLTVDGCKKFLSSKWLDVLTKRLEEAAIPESDKVYCPYTNCSALMSKVRIHGSQLASSSAYPHATPGGCTLCQKCQRYFCVECRVPWHKGMACQEYQRRASHLHGEDAKLHLLAKDQRWRRCVKCKHMIELAEGCYHMTCRCGYEFCYVCGAEWRNKKQTCNCNLWDEPNILREPLTDDETEDEYDSDDFYADYYADDYRVNYIF